MWSFPKLLFHHFIYPNAISLSFISSRAVARGEKSGHDSQGPWLWGRPPAILGSPIATALSIYVRAQPWIACSGKRGIAKQRAGKRIVRHILVGCNSYTPSETIWIFEIIRTNEWYEMNNTKLMIRKSVGCDCFLNQCIFRLTYNTRQLESMGKGVTIGKKVLLQFPFHANFKMHTHMSIWTLVTDITGSAMPKGAKITSTRPLHLNKTGTKQITSNHCNVTCLKWGVTLKRNHCWIY